MRIKSEALLAEQFSTGGRYGGKMADDDKLMKWVNNTLTRLMANGPK